jgi:hypothetical protein
MARSALLVLVACAQLGAGCSLVLTRRPPIPEEPAVPMRCPESRAAPVADTVVAAAMLGASAALIVAGATIDPARNRSECASCFVYAVSLVPLTYAAAAGASAWVGYDRTARCRRVHAWRDACLGGDRDACRKLQAEAAAP